LPCSDLGKCGQMYTTWTDEEVGRKERQWAAAKAGDAGLLSRQLAALMHHSQSEMGQTPRPLVDLVSAPTPGEVLPLVVSDDVHPSHSFPPPHSFLGRHECPSFVPRVAPRRINLTRHPSSRHPLQALQLFTSGKEGTRSRGHLLQRARRWRLA